jgi:hypothetical protein
MPTVRPPAFSHSIWSTPQAGAEFTSMRSLPMLNPSGTGSYVWWRKPGPSAAPGWFRFCASGSEYVLVCPSRVRAMNPA